MWSTLKLGDLCEILDTRRKPITKKNRISGEYPYYGATGIVDWVAEYIFDEELVLIGEDGAKWGAGEKTAFIVKGKYWVNNHAHVVKPKSEKILNKWLTYYLCGIDLKPWVSGMTVPKLNQAQLKSIPIPLPSLEEQQRIVAKLETTDIEIDKSFTACSHQLKNLRNLNQKILDMEFFSESETLEFENIVSEKNTGLERRANLQGSSRAFPYLKMNNITSENKLNTNDYISVDASTLEVKKHTLHEGDFLFNTRNSTELVGKSAVVSGLKGWLFNNNILRVKFIKGVNSNYINYFFCSNNGKRQLNLRKTGTTNVAAIYYKDLKTIRIPMLPKDKQNTLVNKMREIEKQYNIYTLAINKKISNLKSLKSSILSEILHSNVS